MVALIIETDADIVRQEKEGQRMRKWGNTQKQNEDYFWNISGVNDR
jgi:hypothetical protein